MSGVPNLTPHHPEGQRRQGRSDGPSTVKSLADAAAGGVDTAILQAAPDGVNIYRSVGLSEFGEITEFKPHLA